MSTAPTRPRGRPPLHEPEALRKAVEHAALQLFSSGGRSGTSMSAIADRAGISRPMLYAVAPSKDKLYEALLAREIERFIAAVIATYDAPAATPRERIRNRYRAIVDFADTDPLSFAFLQRARAEGAIRARRRRAARRDVLEALTETLARELEQIDYPVQELPRVLAVLFLSLGEGAASGCIEYSTWDADAVIELVTELTVALFTRIDRRFLDAVDRPCPSP